jgi:hypothetical protein
MSFLMKGGISTDMPPCILVFTDVSDEDTVSIFWKVEPLSLWFLAWLISTSKMEGTCSS